MTVATRATRPSNAARHPLSPSSPEIISDQAALIPTAKSVIPTATTRFDSIRGDITTQRSHLPSSGRSARLCTRGRVQSLRVDEAARESYISMKLAPAAKRTAIVAVDAVDRAADLAA